MLYRMREFRTYIAKERWNVSPRQVTECTLSSRWNRGVLTPISSQISNKSVLPLSCFSHRARILGRKQLQHHFKSTFSLRSHPAAFGPRIPPTGQPPGYTLSALPRPKVDMCTGKNKPRRLTWWLTGMGTGQPHGRGLLGNNRFNVQGWIGNV